MKIFKKPEDKPLELEDYPEYQTLLKHYNAYSNTYDFTQPFLDKIKQKGIGKEQLIALTGLTKEIKDPHLQNKLYKIIIEELVIHMVKE